MKKLLNTLYVTTPDVYLALDGENVVVKKRIGWQCGYRFTM